jgi:hypothetical protein
VGSRLGWWHFRTGFSMLRWAADGGLLAAAVAIAGLILSRRPLSRLRLILSISGIVIGLVVVGVLWSWWCTAQVVPAIHDITTDTDNPPAFVSILPLRKDAPNPADYEGPELAAKQKAAYPDLAPAMLPLPPPRTFEQALQVARDMGWTIVNSTPLEGRIEAIDTTFWFGFKDDIVIRIDVGTNAKRIRKFLKKLKETS